MADKNTVKRLFKKDKDAKEEPSREDQLNRIAKVEDLPDDGKGTAEGKATRKVLGNPDFDQDIDLATGRDARYERSADTGTGATAGANLLERSEAVKGDPRLSLRPEDQAEVDEAAAQRKAFKEGFQDEDFAIEGLDAPAEQTAVEKAVSGAASMSEPQEWTGGGGWKYKYKPAVNGEHSKYSTIEITDPSGKSRGTIDPKSEHFKGILEEFKQKGHGFGTKIDPAYAKGAPAAAVPEGPDAEGGAGEPMGPAEAPAPPGPEGITEQDRAAWSALSEAAPEAGPVADAALENAAPAEEGLTWQQRAQQGPSPINVPGAWEAMRATERPEKLGKMGMLGEYASAAAEGARRPIPTRESAAARAVAKERGEPQVTSPVQAEPGSEPAPDLGTSDARPDMYTEPPQSPLDAYEAGFGGQGTSVPFAEEEQGAEAAPGDLAWDEFEAVRPTLTQPGSGRTAGLEASDAAAAQPLLGDVQGAEDRGLPPLAGAPDDTGAQYNAMIEAEQGRAAEAPPPGWQTNPIISGGVAPGPGAPDDTGAQYNAMIEAEQGRAAGAPPPGWQTNPIIAGADASKVTRESAAARAVAKERGEPSTGLDKLNALRTVVSPDQWQALAQEYEELFKQGASPDEAANYLVDSMKRGR